MTERDRSKSLAQDLNQGAMGNAWNLEFPYFIEKIAVEAYRAGEHEIALYFFNLSQNSKNLNSPHTGAFFYRKDDKI